MAEEKEVKDLLLEEALEKLTEIAARMEQGGLPLADMMKLYKEGIALSRRCEELLSAAEKEIEILDTENDGNA